MSRLLVILTCVWSLLLVPAAWAGLLTGVDSSSQTSLISDNVRILPGGDSPTQPGRVATFLSTIAGMPFEKAMDIFGRYGMELRRLPGVDYVGLGAEGINVYTTNPAVVPIVIEGLPVITHPPLPTQPHQNPSAESPSDRSPLVAGKPYEEARAIVKRHREEIKKLPSVYAVELGGNSVLVFLIIHSTDGTINPEALQKASAAIPSDRRSAHRNQALRAYPNRPACRYVM